MVATPDAERQEVAWIELTDDGDGIVVRIGGELSLATLGLVQPTLMEAIASATSVTIDLGELTFCDSSGVGTFIAASGKADAYGTEVAVRNLQPPVRRIFRVTDLDRRFGVTE